MVLWIQNYFQLTPRGGSCPGGRMRKLVLLCVVLLFGGTLYGQGAVKTIEDGALDKIQLFVAALGPAPDRVVVIRPFDASTVDMGTGGQGGKEARQQEARTMQNEGPRVL